MCRAVVRTPGPVATQVNERLGSSSVTTYSVGGIRGCSTRTRDPTASGPSSKRRTEVTVDAHSGHRSTSRSTSQTCSTGASTSILVLCSTEPSCSISLLEIDQDHGPTHVLHFGFRNSLLRVTGASSAQSSPWETVGATTTGFDGGSGSSNGASKPSVRESRRPARWRLSLRLILQGDGPPRRPALGAVGRSRPDAAV